jgi:hypothetical protein
VPSRLSLFSGLHILACLFWLSSVKNKSGFVHEFKVNKKKGSYIKTAFLHYFDLTMV